MSSFFEEIKNRKLVRNKYGVYTLNDVNLDRTLGIDDGSFVLTPDGKQIEILASMNYLFGLFGMTVSSFTAIPMGYIVTYKNGGTYITYESFIIQEITALCDKEISKLRTVSNNGFILTKEELERRESLKDVYQKIRTIINEPNKTLLEKSVAISGYFNTSKVGLPNNLNALDSENHSEVMKRFNEANIDNCNKNDILICNILAGYTKEKQDLDMADDDSKMLASDLAQIIKLSKGELMFKINELVAKHTFGSEEEKNLYIQKLFSRKELYDVIMNEYILSGYFTYRGRDRNKKRIPQDSQILNKRKQIDIIGEKINDSESNGYLQHRYLKHVLNLCSTDYSADIVEDMLRSISTFYGFEDRVKKVTERFIKKNLPMTPHNTERKQETRHSLNLWEGQEDSHKIK